MARCGREPCAAWLVPARSGLQAGADRIRRQRSAFAALKSNRINVAWTSTADPAIPEDSDGPQGTVLLADHKPMLIQAENAVPLYRRNELDPQQVLALNQIAGALDTAALGSGMHRQVAAGADPRVLAPTSGWPTTPRSLRISPCWA